MRTAFKSVLSLAIVLWIGAVLLQPALAGTPEVRIATEALFDTSTVVPANLLLSLSIDKNTVGAAYRTGDAAIYDSSKEYQGYFNSLKCYSYSSTAQYFEIETAVSATARHECDGKTFSGNFMNWASMSTIDLLRYGLTGGDRLKDEVGLTTLQRAYLPSDFLRSENLYLFPQRNVGSANIVGGSKIEPSKVTPFTQTNIKLVSCNNKIIIADSGTNITNCGLPNMVKVAAAEYVLAVKVCDAKEGSDRTDLCQKFGDNYKPVGSLQRNANKMRMGLMTYLASTTEDNRYGGVLRSPMKFLGPKKFDGAGYSEATNELSEWDSSNGILYTNPYNATASDTGGTSGKSGLTNYINQFGRSGNYRSVDPVSELFYEGIRYLQGKQPTADATSGITDTMKDKYPVISTWTDPVIASCQRNQIAVVADAFTNYDFYVPGNSINPLVTWNEPVRPSDAAVANQTPALDVASWTHKLGDMEVDANGSAGNPAKDAALTNLELRQTGLLKYGSYYISGLAYWANTNNIRLDKPVRVKTFMIDLDEGGNGLVDNGLRMPDKPRESQLYLAAKYGGFDDVSAAATPNPFVSLAADGVIKVNNSTLSWDANRDGIPDNYFLASQPGTLVQALRKISPGVAAFSSMSLAAPAVDSTSLAPGDSFLYQAGFRAPQWIGMLRKLKISAADAKDAASALTLTTTTDWNPANTLTGIGSIAASPQPESRKIYTAQLQRDSSWLTSSLKIIEFKWDSLNINQKALLNTSPIDGSSDSLGSKRVDYLRGVRTDEIGHTNGFMRNRISLLGDIINSNIVLVGASSKAIQGAGYKTFYDAKASRKPTVYVGANDGMLHAFDAATGSETFAYIPQLLLPQLNQLTSPAYVHRPYLDGQIAVTEAMVGTNWKTVLAAGFGGGAKGVFALDVSDPANFATGGGVLFEFSNADDADMGNLMGAPVIAKFKTGVDTNGVAQYKYFVVVPSGLNNYSSESTTPPSGAVFLLSLDKATSAAWSLDVNYYKIKLKNLNSSAQYGVSPPALAVGMNGAVQFAYVGDLQGNLWRLNFTGAAPWSSALGSDTDKPLFSAVDDSNPAVAQPITVQPKIVFAPGGGYVVLFGTGKYVEKADMVPGNFNKQSFYAIYDSTEDSYRVKSRDDLKKRSLTLVSASNAYTIFGEEFIYAATKDFESLAKKGWYFDFLNSDDTGERAVANPLLVDAQLYFNTIMPGNDPCAAAGGRAYSMNALYGLSDLTGFSSTVGLLSAPVVFQTGNATSGHRNAVGKRTASKSMRVLNVGAGSSGNTQQSIAESSSVTVKMPVGRFSWREITNWQELRDAAK